MREKQTVTYRGAPERFPFKPGGVVAIGNFDGVHLGHQSLISEVVREAKARLQSGTIDVPAVLMSFYPHPGVVLGKAARIPLLTPLRQKIELLTDLGIDVLYLIHFTSTLRALSAADFLARYVVSGINASHMILGPDTALGKGRAGDVEFIQGYLKSTGRSTQIMGSISDGGERISSRRIRDLIGEGKIDLANLLLGRRYRIDGRVIRGAARGRQIGVPTANLHLGHQMHPGCGVYATNSIVNGKRYQSVTNVGVRPTFSGTKISVESHLLNFSGDLYNSYLSIEFFKKLRDEIKFPDISALKHQILEDIAAAKAVLGTFSDE